MMIYHALNWQEKSTGSVSIPLSSMRRRSNVMCGLSMSYGKKTAKPIRHYYSAPTLTVRPWTFCAITRQDFRLSSCSAMPSNTLDCVIAKRLPKQSWIPFQRFTGRTESAASGRPAASRGRVQAAKSFPVLAGKSVNLMRICWKGFLAT